MSKRYAQGVLFDLPDAGKRLSPRLVKADKKLWREIRETTTRPHDSQKSRLMDLIKHLVKVTKMSDRFPYRYKLVKAWTLTDEFKNTVLSLPEGKETDSLLSYLEHELLLIYSNARGWKQRDFLNSFAETWIRYLQQKREGKSLTTLATYHGTANMRQRPLIR